MKKTALTLLTIGFAAVSAFSQTVEDGIKFLYYEKNNSAIAALKKVVADKPKDAQAIYWLGQAYLNSEFIDSAKNLYQAKLGEGVNDPWLWVGSGHVELMSGGDVNAAKQKFEQAITASTPTKGKSKNIPDAGILTAIGRANADGSSKQGDPQYGVDKLKQALDIDKTNPDIPVQLGLCYLKQGSDKGGEAVEAFREALTRNPNYAQADYRIGRVYQSQNNLEAMNEWYGKAIAADPAFAPVYLTYFRYYSERDVNVAKEYLDKYVANADPDCKTDFFVADYLFRAGKYQESLAKAKQMEAGPCKTFPLLNILYAYNYQRTNDTAQAKTYVEKFFATADSATIEPDHYLLAASVLKRFPGSEETAAGYLQRAIANDTSAVNKGKYMDSIAAIYRKAGMTDKLVEVLQQNLAMTPHPGKRDIYDLGTAALAAKKFDIANQMFTRYRDTFPDEVFGYKGLADVAQAEDSTLTKAVTPINDYINFMMKDTTKNGSRIAYYHAILGGYYANTASNIDSSIAQFEQAVQFDPSNTQYQGYLKQLQTVKENANKPKKTSPAAKPKKTTKGK